MSMFCFQCEQTANKKGNANGLGGCTLSGVCGKKPHIANLQDELTAGMIALAAAVQASGRTDSISVDLITDGLFTTLTNVSFDGRAISVLIQRVTERARLFGDAEKPEAYSLFHGDVNLVSLRSTLLFGLRGMAAYAHHARAFGKRDEEVDAWIIKGMAALGKKRTAEEWLALIIEFGKVNFRCMEILEEAHTGAYGNPVPVNVPLAIDKGPFIVITGHDLSDLSMLLEQTEGRGVNVYTHGEMLPAHGYPALKKFAHLKGNFGTAWQNQQNEFDNLPAPVLFTTNCLMTPRESYADRCFTTSVVSFPELKHIESTAEGHKDFGEIIDLAIKLGGYKERREMRGINGGTSITTGFGKQTVLDNAPAIIDAVRTGAIKHFFLVGGCDGARQGRNYYTEFAKKTPKDTVILTLACGKYRLNDLELGSIGPFPRILDMGQCNDAYGAIKVALALAEAFNCEVNDLPLTLVLSWYEQKAVCILLTLLSLGVKNIYIGPSIPAFFSEDVLKIIVDKFGLKPISDPEQDLCEILGKK